MCAQERRWPSPISSFLLKQMHFLYLWRLWAFVAARGLSLVVATRGYSLVAVHGVFIAVASLVAEPRL